MAQSPPDSPQTSAILHIDKSLSELDSHELFWRDKYHILEAHGYRLRPRLHPSWVPSWRLTGDLRSAYNVEDGAPLPIRMKVTDATQVSSGKLVYVKKVTTGDLESTIATMMLADPLCTDPRNHSVPVLEIFQDDEDESISYMVMPFLRLVREPEFEDIEEIIHFVDQILEGLVFMHDQGIAHRDCSYRNIMMDASSMFPKGFHPIRDNELPDLSDYAPYVSRTTASVRYYYIDYGISVHVAPDAPSKLVVGHFGRDQEVPELSQTIPYDPFKVDIFLIGNLFRREFYDVFYNVGFLLPLIRSMTNRDPMERPTAQEAQIMWFDVRKTVSYINRHWRPRKREQELLVTAALDVVSAVKGALHFAKWALSN